MDKVATLQMRYELTALLARILCLLAENTAVSIEAIEVEYALTKDAHVAVHRLRRRLVPFGVMVQFRRGVGYWIDSTTRQRVIDDMQPDQLTLPHGDGGNGDHLPVA